jgi:hypothetical protein
MLSCGKHDNFPLKLDLLKKISLSSHNTAVPPPGNALLIATVTACENVSFLLDQRLAGRYTVLQ